MSNQRIRILAALALSIIATGVIGGLALLGKTVPAEMNYLAVASYTFLFGVTTNGSNKPLG